MTLMRLRDVEQVFEGGGRRRVHAVNGVSLGLLRPTAGSVEFDGQDLNALSKSELRALRSQMQVVFQEPYESLNPRMRVGDIIAEPLLIHGVGSTRAARRRKVFEVLERVGLSAEHATRLPRDLSGGQQQRVGVARAVITEPRLVLLDEPTSSLDVSVRARVLELLRELQREQGIAYIFISHDLATVQAISDRVDVMYLGKVVESGPTAAVLNQSRHPYTRALISATLSTVPGVKKLHLPLTGEIPNPTEAPTACVLAGRCPIEIAECSDGPIAPRRVGDEHDVRCLRADHPELLAQAEGQGG